MKNRWIAVCLLLALMMSLCVGAVSCKDPDPDASFDYLGTDLSSYVTLDPADYRGLNIEIKWDEITEADVDEWIDAILVSYRSDKPLNDGAGVTDAPITLGDEVYVYYYGYTVDENGTKTAITGGSNMTSTTPDTITVGAREFVSGFETAFLGKTPAELTKIKTSGAIADGDYITMTYFAVYPDKTYGYHTDTFRFAEEDRASIDATYGEGFYEVIVDNAMEYGVANEKAYISSATLPYTSEAHGEGQIVYQDIVFKYGTDRADGPLVATTYFPADYENEALRCKTVYFDMYLDYTKNYVVQYDTPTFDESFLLGVAEVDIEKLEGYEGDTLTDKYRSMVRELLEGNALARREEYEALLLDAVVTAISEKATVHLYPEEAINEQIAMMEQWLDGWVEYYVQMGYTADREAIAKNLLGYTTGTYTEQFKTLAEQTVAGTMALYQMAKQEGLLLSGSALTAAIEAAKQELFALSLSQNEDEFDRDNYDSDESYQAALDDFFEEMVTYYTQTYGDTYFEEYAQDQAIIDRLDEVFTISIVGRKES